MFEHIEHGEVAGLLYLRILSVCGFLSDFKLLETTGPRVGWVRRRFFFLLFILSPFCVDHLSIVTRR